MNSATSLQKWSTSIKWTHWCIDDDDNKMLVIMYMHTHTHINFAITYFFLTLVLLIEALTWGNMYT